MKNKEKSYVSVSALNKDIVESPKITEILHKVKVETPDKNIIPLERKHVTHPPAQMQHRIPINIETRGPSEEYRQLGVLTNVDNTNIIPLYGRRLYHGASKWNYYTQTDRFVSVNIPVFAAKKDCSAEYGCNELTDGDEVTVPQYSESFKVTMYHLDGPRYIPYL
tara:strand:- start:150 stop:644 length:495 start_codon:yes stop_codon:yes gene_type:complete